jgi:protease IV
MATTTSRFADILRSFFYVLLIITIGGPLVMNMYRNLTKSLQAHTKVGLLELKGLITDSTEYVAQLRKYFEDSDIKAIVLKIDSPGGVSGSSQVIFQEIGSFKKEHPKPIVTLVENVCASGAYWVASATDHIIASPVAKIGSIGVLIPNFRLKEFIEYYKVHYDAIKAGTYKNVGDPLSDITPEQKAHLQELANETYEVFSTSLANRRGKLDYTKLKDWADGKVFIGKKALELGLIDELGTLSTVQAWLKKHAPIEGKIEWIKPTPPSFWEKLMGQQNPEVETVSTVVAASSNEKSLLAAASYFIDKLNRSVMLVG